MGEAVYIERLQPWFAMRFLARKPNGSPLAKVIANAGEHLSFESVEDLDLILNRVFTRAHGALCSLCFVEQAHGFE